MSNTDLIVRFTYD